MPHIVGAVTDSWHEDVEIARRVNAAFNPGDWAAVRRG